jgi:hypothetical protein
MTCEHHKTRKRGTKIYFDGIFERLVCVKCGLQIKGNFIKERFNKKDCNHSNLIKDGSKLYNDGLFQRLLCKDCGLKIKGIRIK